MSVPVSRKKHFHVNKMVSKLITTGSLLYENPDSKRTVLTEQKLDAVRASLGTSPRNLLNDYITRRVFLKLLHEETKFLKLRPYRKIRVPVLKNLDQVATLLSGITQKQHPLRNFKNF